MVTDSRDLGLGVPRSTREEQGRTGGLPGPGWWGSPAHGSHAAPGRGRICPGLAGLSLAAGDARSPQARAAPSPAASPCTLPLLTGCLASEAGDLLLAGGPCMPCPPVPVVIGDCPYPAEGMSTSLPGWTFSAPLPGSGFALCKRTLGSCVAPPPRTSKSVAVFPFSNSDPSTVPPRAAWASCRQSPLLERRRAGQGGLPGRGEGCCPHLF